MLVIFAVVKWMMFGRLHFLCFSFLFVVLFCSVSCFCTERLANLWSVIDEVWFWLGNGEKQGF